MTWLDTLIGRDRSLRPTPAPTPAPSAMQSPEDAAAFCLKQLLSLVRADTGQAYLLHPAYGQYRLVAAQGEQAAPVLDPTEIPPEPGVAASRGGERWLTLPCGGALVLRARLRPGQAAPADLAVRGEHIAQAAVVLVETARHLAEARREAAQAQTRLLAAHMAADVALKPHRALELLFHFPLRLLGATDGGLVVEGESGDGPSLVAAAGRGSVLTVKLLGGVAPVLLQAPTAPDLVTGAALGPFLHDGVCGVARIPVPGGAGCAYYFLYELPENLSVAALGPLSVQLGQLLRDEGQTARTSALYLSTLRSFIATLDNSVPYTVGHSARLAMYAQMIARELGLPEGQVEAIALGALLHDVGMTFVDTSAFLRDGKLTSDEYQAVQEHTRLGSELVAPVRAALPLSPMVAHHHERWDGRGYPGRLKGKDIPLGARIIAVADVFEAKTTGRAYRRPLPFQRALLDLQGQVGLQLDPEVVAAFVRAYQKVRQQVGGTGPIAPCWQVRQIPAEICGECPNRTGTAPCWENPGQLCSRHGEECASCLVYTEAVSRASSGP